MRSALRSRPHKPGRVTATELRSAIDTIDRKLRSGATEIVEDGERIVLDHAALRTERAVLVARLNKLKKKPVSPFVPVVHT